LTQSFAGATYQEWEDLDPPVVRVSADGGMAWMMTRVRVRRGVADSSDVQREARFVYAGIDTFEKRSGEWVRLANVSTFDQGP
jgi:hypothetical protein